MKFNVVFTDPFQEKLIELGTMSKEEVLQKFEQIPWLNLLQEMKQKKEDEIYYSPSFDIENTETGHGICVSILEENCWYVFYRRPKHFTSFFGLIKRFKKDYTSDILDQSRSTTEKAIHALLNDEYDYLETITQ